MLRSWRRWSLDAVVAAVLVAAVISTITVPATAPRPTTPLAALTCAHPPPAPYRPPGSSLASDHLQDFMLCVAGYSKQLWAEGVRIVILQPDPVHGAIDVTLETPASAPRSVQSVQLTPDELGGAQSILDSWFGAGRLVVEIRTIRPPTLTVQRHIRRSQ